MVAAVVLAACGGGGGGSGSGTGGNSTDDRAAAETQGDSCERDDDEVLDTFVTILTPSSGPDDILRVLQFGDDGDVQDYVETAVTGAAVYINFAASEYFIGGTVVGEPSFVLEALDYLGDDEAAQLIFAVEQELTSGPARVQDFGRVVCNDGSWLVLLSDLCGLMSASEPCPSEVEALAARGFVDALNDAELPPPVEQTVPPTEVTGPPSTFISGPSGPADGVCPNVGEPCIAGSSDPDCICVPGVGGPGSVGGSWPVLRPAGETVCTR